MESYRKASGAGCDYTMQDIEACISIVDAYLAAVDQQDGENNSEHIMGEVQKAVTNLNKLNETCGGSLIETDQREEICEIIAKAARYAGLRSSTSDITERWREW